MKITVTDARVHFSWRGPDGAWNRLTWDATAAGVVLPGIGDPAGPHATITLWKPVELPREPSDEARLAFAVLDGEEAAQWPLIDEILGRRDAPAGFVPRAELLALLRKLEWEGHRAGVRCPSCGAFRSGSFAEDGACDTHHAGCALARAIGGKRRE